MFAARRPYTARMKRLVEIRSYKLKPGAASKFHRVVVEQAIPMLRRWKLDVVAFGPSAHEADTYFLVRSFKDLDDLRAQQGAFYGSEEWKTGPRAQVIGEIDGFLNTVLWLSPAAIEDMRALNRIE